MNIITDKAANLMVDAVTLSKSSSTSVPGTGNFKSLPPVIVLRIGFIKGIIIPSIKSPATSFKLEPIIKPIAKPKTLKLEKIGNIH